MVAVVTWRVTSAGTVGYLKWCSAVVVVVAVWWISSSGVV
jgi:hypothetical protein